MVDVWLDKGETLDLKTLGEVAKLQDRGIRVAQPGRPTVEIVLDAPDTEYSLHASKRGILVDLQKVRPIRRSVRR